MARFVSEEKAARRAALRYFPTQNRSNTSLMTFSDAFSPVRSQRASSASSTQTDTASSPNPPLTAEEKKEYLSKVTGVCLGSDAFFPFGDNIERARRSGVTAIVQPGGSIRDQQVIDTCNKYGIAMAFCGLRLFHH